MNFKVPENLVTNMRERGIKGYVQEGANAYSSNTNFNYYSVRIEKLPEGVNNAAELLEKIRLNLGTLLDAKTNFSGYNSEEMSKWQSSNPVGSVMSFNAYFKVPFTIYTTNLDDASVITSAINFNGFWF